MNKKKNINITLKIWRQENQADRKGKMVDYKLENVSPDSSFLEMLDMLNEQLAKEGIDTVSFDHDCREGICGACSLMINGKAHGPKDRTTTCQQHMRSFKDGETIVIEPWRAKAFPVLKDLMVDRDALDSIIAAGGYTSVNTGNAQEANATLIPKKDADEAMDAAACIGCGACVASCKNASAMLFTAAKVSQLSLLPQGQIENFERADSMVKMMDYLEFGNCTNEYECTAACPKEVGVNHLARLNREFTKSQLK